MLEIDPMFAILLAKLSMDTKKGGHSLQYSCVSTVQKQEEKGLDQ